ncbi:MAG TPA: leucyl aminopeptidase, partial [Nitrospiria bacterium]
MDIQLKKGRIEKEAAEAAVLGLFEGEKTLAGDAAAMDRALKGQIRAVFESGEFRGRPNEMLMLRSRGGVPAKRVLLAGLGKRKDLSLERVRQAMGTAARQIRDRGLASFSVPLLGSGLNKITPAESGQAVVEGSLLGLYQFTAYRTEKREEIREVRQITLTDPKIAAAAPGVKRGQVLAEAANYVRDLCNHPSNVVTPTRLAEEAQELARVHGLICRVIEKSEAESLGMGAYLGVARGSLEPPKFIILEYHGGSKKGAPIAIVGKSITFDSGGISIKPAENMEQMKTDMSGGAAVLGTLKALAQLKIPLTVIGLLPATENMPSGTAIKPGDVLKSLSGKTIEVINTDAEGRLILADALAYAVQLKPAAIVDLATLTGACVVALGAHATGILGTDSRLIDSLKQAGERCGERVWELPLWEVYTEQIKSDVADMKN